MDLVRWGHPRVVVVRAAGSNDAFLEMSSAAFPAPLRTLLVTKLVGHWGLPFFEESQWVVASCCLSMANDMVAHFREARGPTTFAAATFLSDPGDFLHEGWLAAEDSDAHARAMQDLCAQGRPPAREEDATVSEADLAAVGAVWEKTRQKYSIPETWCPPRTLELAVLELLSASKRQRHIMQASASLMRFSVESLVPKAERAMVNAISTSGFVHADGTVSPFAPQMRVLSAEVVRRTTDGTTKLRLHAVTPPESLAMKGDSLASINLPLLNPGALAHAIASLVAMILCFIKSAA